MIEKSRCTGCMACASICPAGCISMIADENGFFYPTITDETRCTHCGLCDRVCPILHPTKGLLTPKAYAAYAIDEDSRAQSSSGGVFTELARIVLSNGGVVYGAAYDENFRVVHIGVEDEDALSALRGAKYAQSDLADIFTDVKAQLKRGRQVLFSGTPCQVAGLKSFLGQDSPNLICIDFVCHGIPSPMAWSQYVAHMEKAGKISSINLRSKETGWSRYRYSNVFTYENGTRSVSPSGSSLYMKLFVGDYINRRSCEHCSFKGISRVSDLTLGDFWGIWNVAPEMDDDRGTSAVLIQSEKGKKLWDQIDKNVKKAETSPGCIVRNNPSAITSSEASRHRETVLSHLRSGQISLCEKLLENDKPKFYQIWLRRCRKAIRLLIRR